MNRGQIGATVGIDPNGLLEMPEDSRWGGNQTDLADVLISDGDDARCWMPDSPDTLVDGLWNDDVSPQDYGERGQYYEHLLEQYKMYVEGAVRIGERRDTANAFFLTFHTLVISGAGFLYLQGPQLASQWVILIPLVATLVSCYMWWRVITSYKQLNTAKFKVIGEFEKSLPTSPYWRAEWENALAKGKHREVYMPLANVERWVPIVFGGLYLMGVGIVLLF